MQCNKCVNDRRECKVLDAYRRDGPAAAKDTLTAQLASGSSLGAIRHAVELHDARENACASDLVKLIMRQDEVEINETAFTLHDTGVLYESITPADLDAFCAHKRFVALSANSVIAPNASGCGQLFPGDQPDLPCSERELICAKFFRTIANDIFKLTIPDHYKQSEDNLAIAIQSTLSIVGPMRDRTLGALAAWKNVEDASEPTPTDSASLDYTVALMRATTAAWMGGIAAKRDASEAQLRERERAHPQAKRAKTTPGKQSQTQQGKQAQIKQTKKQQAEQAGPQQHQTAGHDLAQYHIELWGGTLRVGTLRQETVGLPTQILVVENRGSYIAHIPNIGWMALSRVPLFASPPRQRATFSTLYEVAGISAGEADTNRDMGDEWIEDLKDVFKGDILDRAESAVGLKRTK